MKGYLIWVSLAAFLVAGCAMNVQSNLRQGGDELKYQYSNDFNGTKSGTLEIRSFVVDDVLAPDTKARWTSGLVLPLVFFTIWYNEYQCSLGYNQITNDYKQFMRESLIEEVKRNSAFTYVEQQGTLAMDITISKIAMSAAIKGLGAFVLFLTDNPTVPFEYKSDYSGEPVNVDIQAKVVLKKGHTTVFASEIHGKYEGWEQDSIIPKQYTSSLTSGLSMAIKNLNANIVKAVNRQEITVRNLSR
jgi:hypothetical protein